ncbi:MAG: hypothetical protein ACTHJ0_10270 [Flavipsychrobacter sp.]
MPNELTRYKEPLEDSEMAFLQHQEEKERHAYYKFFRICMIISFVAPFIGSWYRAFDGAPNAFSPARYFVTTGVLLGISVGATIVGYRVNIRKMKHDIQERTKTIEMTHVTKRVHATINDTYYFYLDSPTKLSIEVSPEDFYRFKEGDEISIEYITYSKFYLGYF